MNVTATQIRPGDTVVTFPVTPPLWTDVHSVASRSRGRLVSLSFTTPLEQAPVPYRMTCWTEFETPTYPFVLMTNAPKNNTATKINERLETHRTHVADFWPLQAQHPRLAYLSDQLDPQDPHWELVLPPKTAFFTSSEVFFPGLGFTGKPPLANKATPEVREIGGRMRRVMTTQCWGFANAAYDQTVVVRGERMLPGQHMDTFLPDGTDIPASVQLQAEFLPMERMLIRLARPRPTDQDSLMAGLEEMLERARRVCGLRTNPMDLTGGHGNSVVISNRAQANTKTRFCFILGTHLADALKVPRAWKLSFDLAFRREVTIESTGGRVDPFQGRWPVTVLVRSQAEAKSFVEGGRGYTGVAALWEERRPLLAVDLGLEFQTNETRIHVEFLDGKRNTVVFEQALEAQLVLAFSRTA